MSKALVLSSFVILHFSFRATAQELPVFRAQASAVLVPVTVTDRDGRFVHGLTAADFEIADSGAPRPITQFSAERVPVSLGILIDVSGSMLQDEKAKAADDQRWADTRQALELLASRLDARDEVFVAVFNEKVALAAPWTRDRARIVRAFDSVKPGGKTAVFESIRRVAPAFQLASYQRKALLLISDGVDTSGRGQLGRPSRGNWNVEREAAIIGTRDLVRKAEAALYAIGLGTQGARVDTQALEGVAAGTGGYVDTLRRSSDFSDAIARMCDDLQSQYMLAFEPAHRDGEFHPIGVRLKRRGLTVRAREGYVAEYSK